MNNALAVLRGGNTAISTYDPELEALLAEEDGGTRLTWRMAFETVQLCETLKGICVPANEENFDRLAAHLTSN